MERRDIITDTKAKNYKEVLQKHDVIALAPLNDRLYPVRQINFPLQVFGSLHRPFALTLHCLFNTNILSITYT